MNIRSIFNKGMLLFPVVLMAPLLAVASPVCTSSGSTPTDLNLNSSVTFSDSVLVTFTCPGVTFNPISPAANSGTDTVALTITGFRVFGDIIDPTLFDTDVVFTGSSGANPFLQFVVSDLGASPGNENVSVSATPEPGSILLFGTGLLIAGGFIRRRLLGKTFA